MLVALGPDGERVAATRTLDRSAGFRCPVCSEQVILKAGAKVIAHFAHRARGGCIAAGESLRHLVAKKLLADRLSELGLQVKLETILSASRRADLLVRDDSEVQFTVEVQDSPISPEEMKARERADRAAGCVDTCWIFTDARVRAAFKPSAGDDPTEVRLPEDVRYRWNATRQPVLVLRVDRGELVGMRLASIDRPADEWYDESGQLQSSMGYTLRSTFAVDIQPLGFMPTGVPDRYGRPHITFEPRPASRPL
jgi:Competence protein CoiA-like family